MTWRDNLRRGSFRGVPFFTTDRTLKGGRRIHNHEPAKGKVNLPEDMGLKTRKFSVDVYLVGDDYMARRDRLVEACEQGGPATFVDFWGRVQRVVLDDYDLKETDVDGRMCRFQLTMLDAGEDALPGVGGAVGPLSATVATQSALESAAKDVEDAADEQFGQLYGD